MQCNLQLLQMIHHFSPWPRCRSWRVAAPEKRVTPYSRALTRLHANCRAPAAVDQSLFWTQQVTLHTCKLRFSPWVHTLLSIDPTAQFAGHTTLPH